MKSRLDVGTFLLAAMLMLPTLTWAQSDSDQTNPADSASGMPETPAILPAPAVPATTNSRNQAGQQKPGRKHTNQRKHAVGETEAKQGHQDIRTGPSEEMRAAYRQVASACENETNLLCKGTMGSSQVRCLMQNEESALTACRNALEELRSAANSRNRPASQQTQEPNETGPVRPDGRREVNRNEALVKQGERTHNTAEVRRGAAEAQQGRTERQAPEQRQH